MEHRYVYPHDDGIESEDSEDEFDDTQYGTMARFVPTLVLERLRAVGATAVAAPKRASSGETDTVDAVADAAEDAANGINSPKVHELDAAVMVVDVSGFSGMCERFAQGFVPDGGWRQRMKGIPSLNTSAARAGTSGGTAGTAGGKVRRSGASHASVITTLYRLSNEKETQGFGAEGVRDALNLTLGRLISTVERHGGDVLRIAGDALIVLFHQGAAGISDDDLTDLCLACTRCGWDCAASVGGGGGGRGGGLSVHVGVGCGRVKCFHVGSDRLGWQLVVSGELFEDQVAKALDASRAGEVVVSAEVWQHLEGTGWGSSPVTRQRGRSNNAKGVPSSPPPPLRLLHCTPGSGRGGPGLAGWWWDDDFVDFAAAKAAAVAAAAADDADLQPGGRPSSLSVAARTSSPAPSHGGGGVGGARVPAEAKSEAGVGAAAESEGATWRGGRASTSDSPPPAGKPRLGVVRRSSYSGAGGRFGSAAAAGGAGGSGLSNGRAASLDNAQWAAEGRVEPLGRWCPSRRRLSLLEEVETGVLTMLSKDVGRALRGYCPQPIREGLVAERLGLLAELQRVAVLFVGLSFKGVAGGGGGGGSFESTAATATGMATGRTLTSGSDPSVGAGCSTGADPDLRADPGLAPAASPSSPSVAAAVGGTVDDRAYGAAMAAAPEDCGGSDASRNDGGGREEDAVRFFPVEGGEAAKADEAEVAAAAALSLEMLQGSFSLLQSIVASHGGVIKELSVDDKGTVLVVGFGLSPRVGRLPAARATLCAMECTDRLRARGLARCHAGIATGPVFCGSLGSADRREFAMISETVNLAQRLMSARKCGRLLPKAVVAHATKKAASGSNPSSEVRKGSPAQPALRRQDVVGSPEAGCFRATRKDGGIGGKPSLYDRDTGLATPTSAQHKGEKTAWVIGGRRLFPLVPVAAAAMSGAERSERGDARAGERERVMKAWQGSFNRWVVLEAETLTEARKTDQLAFLELEAIKVKGKTSKVDVFAPSLTIDLAAVLSAPRSGSPSAAAGRGTAIPSGGGSSGAAVVPAPVPVPPGVILGGRDGGGGVIPPLPSRPLPAPPPLGIAVDGVPAAGPMPPPPPPPPPLSVAESAAGGLIGGSGSSLDDSARYRLESPRRGNWQGGARSRSGSGVSTDGSVGGEPGFADSQLIEAVADPLPEAAARRFASWRSARDPPGPRGSPAHSRLYPPGEMPKHEGGAAIFPGRPGVGVSDDRGCGGGGGGGGSGDGGDFFGRPEGAGGERGGDVLSRDAFEALLPCIFHADAVHDEISHILWARTRGRVSYLADLCRSLVGITRGGGGSGSGGSNSFGAVGEDGTWRLRLNEFAHVLKLASRVPPGVEGALQRRLDELPYNARQVVLRVVCVTVVAGVGETALLLHLLTRVSPFKEYWVAVVSQHEGGETHSHRRRSGSSRRRASAPHLRALTSSPVLGSARSGAAGPAVAANVGVRGSGGSGGRGSGRARNPPAKAATVAAAAAAAAVGGLLSPRGEGQLVSPAMAAAAAAKFFQEEENSGTGDGGRGSERQRARSTSSCVASSKPAAGKGGFGREGTGGQGPQATPPISPAAARSRSEAAGEEALRSCLAMLEAGGFLRVHEGGKTFVCDDVMLMDQVYASTPFKIRKGLHKEAARWISDRHRRDFRDRADVMPMLIHHLTQAHEEPRAQAMLAVLKVLGGRFLDRWILGHVRRMVSIRETPRNPTASEHLALCVLPALPSLRGLSKAIRGAEIAGVVVGVALRLRSLRFKDMDTRAIPRHRRSMSISGSSLKRGGDIGGGGGASPGSKARGGAPGKRRSASLAGSALAPPSASELGLLLPAGAAFGGGSSGSRDVDDERGLPDALSSPHLVASQTA